MPLFPRAATAGLLLVLAPAALAQAPAYSAGDSLETTSVSTQPRSEELVLALRSVREGAALTPGFRRDLATGTLVFRARTGGLEPVQEPVFVVDGVRRLGGPLGASTLSLLGAPDVPYAAVDYVWSLGGFVPADIGEAGGGVVVVTTESGEHRFGGRLEGLSSRLTDDYGSSLVSATVHGPVADNVLFSVTGEARRAADAVPSAGRSLRLTDAAYARFDATPQAILVRDAAGVRTVPLPVVAGGQPFSEADLRAALGLGPGETIENPISAADAATDADLERARAQDDPLTDLALTGQLVAFLRSTPFDTNAGSLSLGGSLFRRTMSATAPTPAEAFARRFSNRDALSRQTADRASAFVAAERIGLPGGVVAEARASFEATGSLLRPAAFSDDVADALRYGDADDAVFAAAQRYVVFTNAGYLPLYGSDGTSGISNQPITGYARPGAPAALYDRQSASSAQAAASLTRGVGRHRISLGGEAEAQTFRRFTLAGGTLAVYADDGNAQPVPGFPDGVSRYDQLGFEALRLSVETYGYTVDGLDRGGSDDAAAYFPDAAGARASTSAAPFRPLTTAGYLRDQFSFGPVSVDAGLRLERYDARATTLLDPFSVLPILRAGALPATPDGIDDDFAVYQFGGQTVGFRDLEGQFYDASGTRASADAVIRDARGSAVQTGAPEAEAYERTRATTRLQPRVGIRVLAARGVVVTGYAMRASRRPDPNLFVPFTAYDQAFGGTRLAGSADLRPEDVRAAGVEVEVEPALNLRFTAGLFGRQTRDIALPRAFAGGLPAYQGVSSYGRRDEAGVDLTAFFSPSRDVSILASYTLARARDSQGSALDGTLFGGGAPAPGDTRHALSVTASVVTPAAAGVLRNIGVGVVVQAQSGLPYTALEPNDRFSVFDPFTPNVAGTINGARLPWTVQADVRLERRIALGASEVTAFVWVENVLGARNTLALYRATGQPDADGFAATESGQQVLNTPGRQLLYAGYTGGPVNVGGRQSTDAPFVYGQPRHVRLGVALGL